MSENPYAPPSSPASPLGPPPVDGDRPRLPWEERGRLGFLNALIETVTLIVTAPRDAFSRLRPDGDYVWPLIFGLIFSWIGQVFNQIWNLISGEALKSMIDSIPELGGFAQYIETSPVQSIVWLIIWPVVYVVAMFLFAGLAHLALMVVSATDGSPLGFEGTFKVVAYTSVLDLLNVIPMIGWILGFLGKLVLYVFGFSQVHRASEGQAMGAVAIVMVTCCCCLPLAIGGFIGLVGGIMGALMSAMGGG